MSEQTEQSLRAIEKQVDALGAALGGKLDLLAQRLEMYDVEGIKKNQEKLREDVTSLKTNMRVGAVVAGTVLVATVGVLFKLFMV